MRTQRRVGVIILGLAILLLLGGVGRATAAPVTVGYYTDFNTGDTGPVAPITANGFTPVQITNLSTFNLSTVNILMVDESRNGSPSADLTASIAKIAAYVAAGGSFIYNSRNVVQGAPFDNQVLPGGSGITLHQHFGSDVSPVTTGNLLTNGPFGTIGPTTLDGGNLSNHGFADASSLPAGAINLLQDDNFPGSSVAFAYHFGAGVVFYGAIPLDFDLDGFNTQPNFMKIYAPNMLAFEHSLQGEIPEPATLSIWGIGIVGIAAYGWRRRRMAVA
jgi:hypothetical protein